MEFNTEELALIFACLCDASDKANDETQELIKQTETLGFLDAEKAKQIVTKLVILTGTSRLIVKILTEKRISVEDEKQLRKAKKNLDLYESILSDLITK